LSFARCCARNWSKTRCAATPNKPRCRRSQCNRLMAIGMFLAATRINICSPACRSCTRTQHLHACNTCLLYCSGAYTAINFRWLLCARALCTARKEVCADGQHESGLAGRSPSVDREVGEGGAQRLLARIGHVGAAVEVEGGERSKPGHRTQHLCRHAGVGTEVEVGKCGEAAHCA
jgi:hypothetical protein